MVTVLEDIAIPTNIWINIIASVKQVSIPLIASTKPSLVKMCLLNFQHWPLSILILETDLASQATTPHAMKEKIILALNFDSLGHSSGAAV
jgi:hypothetical protein